MYTVKIKRIATILLVIGIVASVVSGLSLMELSTEVGVSVMVSGVLFSVLFYYFLTGIALLLAGLFQLNQSVKNIEEDIKVIANNQNNRNQDKVNRDTPSNPSRCKWCGKINDDDADFCVNCGKKLSQ